MKKRNKIILTSLVSGATLIGTTIPLICNVNNVNSNEISINNNIKTINNQDNEITGFVDWDDSAGNIIDNDNKNANLYPNFKLLNDKWQKKYSFSLESYKKYYKNSSTYETFFNLQNWFGINTIISFSLSDYKNSINNKDIILNNITKNEIQNLGYLQTNFIDNFYNKKKKLYIKKEIDNLGYIFLKFITEMDLEECGKRENKVDLLKDFEQGNIFCFDKFNYNKIQYYSYGIKIKTNRRKLDINRLEDYINVKNVENSLDNDGLMILKKYNQVKDVLENDFLEKRRNINLDYYFNIKEFRRKLNNIISKVREFSENYDYVDYEENLKYKMEFNALDHLIGGSNSVNGYLENKNEVEKYLRLLEEKMNDMLIQNIEIKNSSLLKEWDDFKKTVFEINKIESQYLKLEKEYYSLKDEINSLQKSIENKNDVKRQKLIIEFDLQKMKRDSAVDWDMFQKDIVRLVDDYNKLHPDKPMDDNTNFNLDTNTIINGDVFFENLFNCTKQEGIQKLNEILRDKYDNVIDIDGSNWKDDSGFFNKQNSYEYFGYGKVLNNNLEVTHIFEKPTIAVNHEINYKNINTNLENYNKTNEDVFEKFFEFNSINLITEVEIKKFISAKQVFEFNFDKDKISNFENWTKENLKLDFNKNQLFRFFAANKMEFYYFDNSTKTINNELKEFNGNLELKHYSRLYQYKDWWDMLTEKFGLGSVNTENNGSSGISTKTLVIIGSAIGGIVILSIIIGVCVKKRKKRKLRENCGNGSQSGCNGYYGGYIGNNGYGYEW